MKRILLIAAILSAANIAAAETLVLEYPDHYYVEGTGTPQASDVAIAETTNTGVSNQMPLNPKQDIEKPRVSNAPITDFDLTAKPIQPAERYASMKGMIERLEKEQAQLVVPRDGETPEQMSQRENEALGKLRKLNRMRSEIQKIPAR